MAQAKALRQPRNPRRSARITRLRIGIVITIASGWEMIALSGLLFQDVVPSLHRIMASMASLLVSSNFWSDTSITAVEIGSALAIGGSAGVIVGLLLGANSFVSEAYEPYLNYLGPTPKIIFFPVMIMCFGVGWGSKIAMGSMSCFFPIALSTAAGMREVDKVLIRVARSFRLTPWQMITKIYLPAVRMPMLNGLRLGFGVAVIGVLLAETKLSNQGLGYLIIQTYTRFDMPRMYAILLIVFTAAVLVNATFETMTAGGERG